MPSVTFQSNGNLNGRVIRLIADELVRSYGVSAEIYCCKPMTLWPEARQSPHLVEVQRVSRGWAERRAHDATVLVFPATWDRQDMRQQVAVRRAGVATVCILADVEYGTRKLEHLLDTDMPDAVVVPDHFSYRHLLRMGFPKDRLVAAGSPHLDTILSAQSKPFPDGGRRFGALESPELCPGEVNALGQRYRQSDAMQMIKRAASRIPDLELQIRKHPRTPPEGAGDQRRRPTFAEFVGRCFGVVATQSSGLIDARLLGRPAVSLQPVPAGCGNREAIFRACGIPIVRDEEALTEALADLPKRATPPPDTSAWLFNPGQSANVICEVILGMLDRRHPS